MSDFELLTQVEQLSRNGKFQIVQALMAELAKEEGLKPLDFEFYFSANFCMIKQ